MRFWFLLALFAVLLLGKNASAQSKEDILAGKYVVELQQWPEKVKLLKDWEDCVASLEEIEQGIADAKKKGEKDLKKKYLPLFEELCTLTLNKEAGDVAARLRREKEKVIKKVSDIIDSKTLSDWDKRYVFCNEEVSKVESWAEAVSKAAKQFPDDFKGGTLRERMDAMDSEEKFGKPTRPADYGPLDSLVYADGSLAEKNTLLAGKGLRTELYEKAKKYYKKGVHEEKVTSTKGRITRTIVHTELEFKVFEISEPFPDIRFFLIDGLPASEQDFLLELAKYTRIGN